MIFKEDSSWYTRLRRVLHKKYVEECLRTGGMLKHRAPAMTMDYLRTIGRLLFGKNSARSLIDRTLLTQQWTAIGRSSDIGSLRFHVITWKDDCMMVTVNRKKVSVQQSISEVNSALQWELDPLHALACQLVASPFNTPENVFSHIPSTASDEKHFCNYINRLLRAIAQNGQK